jgi:F420H(2)-dependent quinone reductase
LQALVARELPREERDSIYQIVVERAPAFGEYQERTDRLIPVFELITD